MLNTNRTVRLLIALFSGTCGALAFPSSMTPGVASTCLWWLAVPSIIGLYIGLLSIVYQGLSTRLKKALFKCGLYSGAWSLPFFAIQIHWAVYPADSLIPWFALTIIEALFLALHGIIFAAGAYNIYRLFPSVSKQFWLINVWSALCWVSIEQLRSHVPFTGFPWSKLGFSQIDGPFLAWAPWGGTVAVAIAVVFISTAGGQALGWIIAYQQNLRSNKPKVSLPTKKRFMCGTLLILVVFVLLPQFDLPHISASNPPDNFATVLSVLAVQGNVPSEASSGAFGEPLQVLNNHVRATADALKKRKSSPDLVVWPESAADQDPRQNPAALRLIESINRQTQAPLLFGTLRVVPDRPVARSYNEMLLMNQGKLENVYTKVHPVPFGEYLPLREFFSWLYPPAAELIGADMQAGAPPATFKVTLKDKGTITLATPICFEVADDQLVAQSVRNGGQALLFPSSNTFFARSPQAAQQLAIARFRAAEHRRSTIAISTMAPSAPIDARGKLLALPTGHYEPASISTQMHLNKGFTPATVLNPYLPTVVWILTCLWLTAAFLPGLGTSAKGKIKEKDGNNA